MLVERLPGRLCTCMSGPRKVRRCTSVKNSECQQDDLIFNPLRNAQPVKSGKRVSDVIGRSQVKEHACMRQHSVQTVVAVQCMFVG